MKAATILHSDVLDILFEHRNKQYGAYSLRRAYNTRLYQSLGLVMGGVLLLVAGNYFNFNSRPSGNGLLAGPVKDSIELTHFTIIDPPPPPPPPPAPPPSAPHLPTVDYVKPFIVPDTEKADTMPTTDQLDKNVISNKTAPGDGPVNDNSTAGDGHSKESGPAAAPAPEPEPEGPAIVDHADVMPEFPGGMAALLRFLGRNLQVPENGVEPGQRVRVPVKFVVNREGNLSDVEFPAQTDNMFKKEIMRVINKMPRWKPGLQHGKAVAVYYTIPIIFEVTDN